MQIETEKAKQETVLYVTVIQSETSRTFGKEVFSYYLWLVSLHLLHPSRQGGAFRSPTSAT